MAVDRYFFYEIGAFDANMEVRGGENLEIALRVMVLRTHFLAAKHFCRKKQP